MRDVAGGLPLFQATTRSGLSPRILSRSAWPASPHLGNAGSGGRKIAVVVHPGEAAAGAGGKQQLRDMGSQRDDALRGSLERNSPAAIVGGADFNSRLERPAKNEQDGGQDRG